MFWRRYKTLRKEKEMEMNKVSVSAENMAVLLVEGDVGSRSL